MTVAFVGLQHPHSLAIHLSLQQLSEIDQLVVVEPDPEYRARVNAPAFYATCAELFARKRVDAAFILLPPDEAPAAALTCLEHGCHVFLEKHGANSSAALRRVAEAAAERNVQAACGYLWRGHPLTREVKQLLRAGILGEIWAWEARIVTTSIADRLAGAATSQGAVAPVGGSRWLFERERSGGGILVWLACHYLDWMLHVLDTDVVEVAALTARRSEARVDVEDVASISLRTADGALGTLHAGYITPAGFRHKDDAYWGLQGTLGDLRWTPPTPRLEVRSAHPSWRGARERTYTYELDSAPGYGGAVGVGFFRDLLASFAANTRPLAPLDEAARLLEIFEAAYESALRGRRVDLSLPATASAG